MLAVFYAAKIDIFIHTHKSYNRKMPLMAIFALELKDSTLNVVLISI